MSANKSLSSHLSRFSSISSIQQELADLKAKVLYWKQTANNHSANGFHIMAELYMSYSLKAQEEVDKKQEELSDLLIEEDKKERIIEEEGKSIILLMPSHIFTPTCNKYKSVFVEENKEVVIV